MIFNGRLGFGRRSLAEGTDGLAPGLALAFGLAFDLVAFFGFAFFVRVPAFVLVLALAFCLFFEEVFLAFFFDPIKNPLGLIRVDLVAGPSRNALVPQDGLHRQR
jgi:hypothetical protein